jgi:Ser/Thr protein kinase RdoA (MazF antagonist)
MKAAFEQATYRAQVIRLRQLAQQALKRYPFRVEACRFLNHGENTTFQIDANGGRKFLLRIHRNGYHSRSGILEELSWLMDLSSDSLLLVPRPVRSKRGELVEVVHAQAVGSARHCSVLEWIDGRFIRKSLNRFHLNSLGTVIGRLHKRSGNRRIVHRRYWDAEGLVGTHAKLGSVEALPGASNLDQRIISRARRLTYGALKRFETAFPHKQGLIHADLHFGNLILSEGRIAAIDFDDCGFGFNAYDLVVPLRSVRHMVGRRKYPIFKAALLEGYVREMPWDDHDEDILSHLSSARMLAMLGWLNSRSDNPDLRKHYKSAIRKTSKYFQTCA